MRRKSIVSATIALYYRYGLIMILIGFGIVRSNSWIIGRPLTSDIR